jgi:hypothetical protein
LPLFSPFTFHFRYLSPFFFFRFLSFFFSYLFWETSADISAPPWAGTGVGDISKYLPPVLVATEASELWLGGT